MTEAGGRPSRLPDWFDLRLTSGNLITIVAVVIGMVVGWARMEENDRQQAEKIERLEAADDRRAKDIQALGDSLRVELREVKAKTDTILEKLVDRQQATTERVVRVETKVDVVDQKLDDLLRRVARSPP